MPDVKKATILIVDDIPANRNLLRRTLEPEGYEIRLAPNGKVALQLVELQAPDLILLDILMPEIDGFSTCEHLKKNPDTANIPVIFITAKHESESVVRGFQVGGVDYITKPFEREEVLARVKTHLKIDQLTKDLRWKNVELSKANEALRQSNAKLKAESARRERAEDALKVADEELSMLSEQEAARWGIEGFVGQSQTIKKILHEIRQLQEVGTTSVLITGESGTGKELVARAIHFGGPRAQKRFLPLNCSAIPSELAESTPFGHERGAFTGANTSRKGYFEMADGGTLFLDEIGDMPLELQAKLLRTLEDGFITPIGGEEKKVDVRILAATNANLREKIAERKFREYLYFRLTGFTIEVPPLRERREDIPLLANHFLKLFADEMGISRGSEVEESRNGQARERGSKVEESRNGQAETHALAASPPRLHAPTLSREAMEALMNYHFPGNIRELKNIIEHALILSGKSTILPEHLRFIDAGSLLAASTEPLQIEYLVIKRAQPRRQGTILDWDSRNGVDVSFDVEPFDTDEEAILAYIRQHTSITNNECQQLLNVPRHRATYLLQKMGRYGILVREGERRWARYRFP